MRWAFLVLLGACATDAPFVEDGGMDDADLSCAFESVVRARVFEPNCTDSSCHDSTRPRAGLDLERPGITERVVNQPSVDRECGDRILVVPGVARASFLMDKVFLMFRCMKLKNKQSLQRFRLSRI